MLWGTQGSHLPVPQSVAHLICVPQVPQMWHKMWHNSIYILSTNQYMSMKIRPWRHPCRYPSQAGQSGEEDDLTKIFALKKSTTFRKAS